MPPTTIQQLNPVIPHKQVILDPIMDGLLALSEYVPVRIRSLCLVDVLLPCGITIAGKMAHFERANL